MRDLLVGVVTAARFGAQSLKLPPGGVVADLYPVEGRIAAVGFTEAGCLRHRGGGGNANEGNEGNDLGEHRDLYG